MSSTHVTSDERFRLLSSGSQKRVARDGAADGPARDLGESILMGESLAVRRLRSQIQRIAPYFRTALIRGEIGVGKQMVARALHEHSPGAEGPFVVANAGELGSTLVDLARGGTLYLGGVGELSFGLQETLLRFLRVCDDHLTAVPRGVVRRFDEPDIRSAEARASAGCGLRILASSDRDLRTLSAVGHYRQDLYARLSAVEIFVPPLRQRIEDIPMLAAWLLRRLADGSAQVHKMLAETTVAQLQERAWPGNLPELERVVAQAATLAEGGLIEPRHLLALVEPTTTGTSATVKMERLQDVMMRHVLSVLTGCSGNKVRAAEVLGISRSTLYRMLGARPSDCFGASDL